MTSWRSFKANLVAPLGAAVAALALAGCATSSIGDDPTIAEAVPDVGNIGSVPGERVLVPAIVDPMASDPLYADANVGFNTYDWTISDYSPPAGLQNVNWSKTHVALGDEHLSLMITAPSERGDRFAAGEIQTLASYGHGEYEAVLRPPAGSGLLSSFYARSAPEGPIGANEFGFGFQGKDTKDVFVRLVVKGNTLVQERIPMAFDVTEGFHVYGIKWTERALIWSVDDVEVYRVERPAVLLPDRPGYLFANVWTGTPDQAHWMGRPRFASGVSLDIACVAYRPEGEDGRDCVVPALAPRAVADVVAMGQ